jgi:hypothetical protein
MLVPISTLSDDRDKSEAAISPQQCAAVGAPDRRTSDLLGNFGDLESLFEQLASPPVYELGKPLPKSKYMPRKRVGSCPAAHNRALFGEGEGQVHSSPLPRERRS